MPGRYLSDTTARCQTITQTRFFTTYVDSCWTVPGWIYWNPWVIRIGNATVTPAGTAIQAVLPDPSSMIYISRTAVPSAINHVSLLVESVNNPVVISVVEMVDGQEVVLGEQLLQAAQMSTVSFSITPSTPSIRIRVRWFTAPAILRWRTICVQVPQMQSETYLVDVCDEIGDKYRFGVHGMEKDNEWAGVGNHYTTFFREYDSRIGRWISLDPVMAKYPGWSPYVFAFNNPILINDPLGDDPPSIKATLIYGQKNSRTFSSLMKANSITTDNHGSFIFFGHKTETYNGTGKITLAKSEDIKWLTVQLAHEMTNRSNIEKAQTLDKKVSEGKITPKQYAKQLAQVEVAGQINQVKVASEIGYKYPGKEYDALNKVIDRYTKGELTDKDLKKMVGANDEHLGTYERQGTGLRKEYVESEKKGKQMENNINQNMDKLKPGSPQPVDNSMGGNTR